MSVFEYVLFQVCEPGIEIFFRVTPDMVERIPRVPGYSVSNQQMVGHIYSGIVLKKHRMKLRLQISCMIITTEIIFWLDVGIIVGVRSIYEGTQLCIGRNTSEHMLDLRTHSQRKADGEQIDP